MASILMPTQKFQFRKRHQFWCHRRKMAPFRSHEPDKHEYGSESEPKIKNFREERIKTGFSCSTPWGGENNFSISDKKVSKEYWGRKFRSRYNFWSLSVRTSEKKIKISFNPQFWVFLAAYLLRRIFSSGGLIFDVSRCLPSGEINILLELV